MNDHEVKLTVTIPEEEYYKFTGRMHQGQISQVIRKFVRSVNTMREENTIDKFYAWAYGTKSVTLKQPKEE